MNKLLSTLFQMSWKSKQSRKQVGSSNILSCMVIMEKHRKNKNSLTIKEEIKSGIQTKLFECYSQDSE